jgi:hypothetical protein
MTWQEFHESKKEWYAQSMFGCAYTTLRDPKLSMVDDEMATHWIDNNIERILKGE